MFELMTGSKSRIALPFLKWAVDPVIFVEPQEIAAYRLQHPLQKLIELPKNDGGFSYLMNQMARRAINQRQRYFIFTDDDVTDLRDRESVPGKFVRVQKDRLWAVLKTLVEKAEKLNLAQLAVSFAGQSWAATKTLHQPSGAWGVHITDARAVEKVGWYDESLICFGDWEMSARLMQAGYQCWRTNLVTFVHKMNSMQGGASEIYKKQEAVKSAAEAVARKYPHAARVKFVPEHNLHEIRFNWKSLRQRACEQSQS